jgi:hypothetical protein
VDGRRGAALAAGAGALAAGWWWLHGGPGTPLYRYDLDALFSLGSAEAAFTLRYLLVAGAAAGLIGWGGAPLAAAAARRFPALPFLPALGLLAAFTAAAVLVLARTVLRDQVVTDDEYVYLFQARLLLSGHVAAPSPELPEFFNNVFVCADGTRWFGQYPPGHPMMLVPGVALGFPRVVPALLTGLNVFLTGLVLRPLAGAAWALAGALLLVASPLFLLTGATYLSHSTAYAGLALAVLAAARVGSGGGAGWGAAAGAGIGVTLLARPWTGVVLGAFPAGLLLLGAIRRRRWRGLVFAAVVVVAAGALYLAANAAVSGSPWRTGYDAVRSGGDKEFGFGTILAGRHAHTPGRGLVNAGILAFRFLAWSFAWALPGWLLASRSRRSRSDPGRNPRLPHARTVAAGAAAMLLAGLLSYVPYWASGVNDTGPLMTYELLLPLGVLLVVGARAAGAAGGAGAAAALAAAALLFWPVQVRHLRAVTARVREPLAAVEQTVRPPALVFTVNVQGPEPGSWVFGPPDPDPGLRDPVVYVRDRGVENDALRRLHPGRRAYRLDVGGDGPRVVPLDDRPGGS